MQMQIYELFLVSDSLCMRLEDWNFLEFLSGNELDSYVESSLTSQTMSTMNCYNAINKLVDLFFDTMPDNIVHISRVRKNT